MQTEFGGGQGPAASGEGYGARQRVGLALGPLLLALTLVLPAPEGLSDEGWRAAGVAALMAAWWISEALPIPATALVPLALFPLLGVAPIGEAARPYANPLIFLFLGGFMIALAMQRWNLHRRIALAVLGLAGERPAGIVAGFMAATAFLSMWVSNTATTMMMLPIGISVIELIGERERAIAGEAAGANFAVALMLGIAYAASIGGVATLIGTPPNALLAGFMAETYGFDLGFARWMMVGLPLSLVMLPLAWLMLTRLLYPVDRGRIEGSRALLAGERRALGAMSRGEKTVAAVATLTALMWMSRPLIDSALPGLGLSDAGIAIAAALVLFVVPVDLAKGQFALDWETARGLPIGVLILFGGGLSLAAAISATGLAAWIGTGLGGLGGLPVLLVVLAIVAVIVFLTELTSNTATAAAFLPVLAAFAVSLGENPLLFAAPAALAASCAFMLPVATPPNAIVFGSRRVTVPQMARAGIWLNLVAIAAITALAYALLGVALGVAIGEVPGWTSG